MADAAAEWLRDRVAVSAADRSSLRSRLRDHDATPPDYDVVHASFAAEFLLVNIRKCAAALADARPAPASTVVDLGCGSGAAAAAALAHLAERGFEEVRVHLLDRSQRQLDLAQDLLETVAARLDKRGVPFRVKITTVRGDWPADALPVAQGPAMVLAAHVLTENQRLAWDFLSEAVAVAGPGGSLTVIERGDDQLWAALDALAAESVLVRRAGSRLVPAATADGTDRTWATRWLTFEPGPHVHCEQAVRRYLTAWRKQDPDLLAAVFTPHARYCDKPFRPPIEGLDGIQEYWRSEVASQRTVTVGVESVAYRPDAAHLEWRAVLHSGDDTVKVVYGFMVIEVDAFGKIWELRECYRSQREARDAAVGSRPGDL